MEDIIEVVGALIPLLIFVIYLIVNKVRGKKVWDDAYYEKKHKVDGIGFICLSVLSLSMGIFLSALGVTLDPVWRAICVFFYVSAAVCLIISIINFVKWSKDKNNPKNKNI